MYDRLNYVSVPFRGYVVVILRIKGIKAASGFPSPCGVL